MDWITTSTILEGLKEFEGGDAWERLVERFRRPIVSFIRDLGLAESDAEDVAQETLIAFAEAYREGKYDPAKGRLSHWLFGIAWVRRRDAHIAGFVVIALGPLEVAWHGSLLVHKRRNPA